MSLINQALRKAQRDRTPPRMADPGAPSPTSIASASGMKPSVIIGLVVAVAVLLGLVIGLSLMLLNSRDTPAQAAPTPGTPSTSSAPMHTPANTQAAPAPATAAPAADEITPAKEPIAATALPAKAAGPATGPTNLLERTETSPVVEELRHVRAAAESRAAAEAQAAQEAAQRAAAQPSQEIIDWLARAQISGVRLSANESRVILNGKSYLAGEYVHMGLGLKVLIIEEERVLFVDDNGKKYLKRL